LVLKGFLIALLLVPVWLYWDLKIEQDITEFDWRLLLVYGLFGYFLFKLQASYTKTKRELKTYRAKDFPTQKGWTEEKQKALLDGAKKGHDLERLAETLGHSVASVRGKLVKSGDYDAYLENYVEQGAQKFAEWQSIQRKIGKVVPLTAVSDTGGLPPQSWSTVIVRKRRIRAVIPVTGKEKEVECNRKCD
jgi:hypothetical protein